MGRYHSYAERRHLRRITTSTPDDHTPGIRWNVVLWILITFFALLSMGISYRIYKLKKDVRAANEEAAAVQRLSITVRKSIASRLSVAVMNSVAARLQLPAVPRCSGSSNSSAGSHNSIASTDSEASSNSSCSAVSSVSTSSEDDKPSAELPEVPKSFPSSNKFCHRSKSSDDWAVAERRATHRATHIGDLLPRSGTWS